MTEQSLFRELTRLYNVQTAYYDVAHRRRKASAESLMAILQALGAPVGSWNDVPSALRERRQVIYRRILEPVTVVWGDNFPSIKVCLPVKLVDYSLYGRLELESGEHRVYKWSVREPGVLKSVDVEGARYLVEQITIPESLPRGYHRFLLEIGKSNAETLIISAPDKAYLPPDDVENRSWGVFIPPYALHTDNGPGSGDYTSLRTLADWVASLGGETISTLPLLPAFLDQPFEPSPYAPVSRLLWNEFFIDIDNVPELSESRQAKEIMESESVLSQIKKLRNLRTVDYRRLMSLKRHVLEECSQHLIKSESGRFMDFQAFVETNPIVKDYARFRAVIENQHSTWPSWPKRLQNGTINQGDYEEKTMLYYTYAQWLAHQQVQELAEGACRRGIKLYFDLPLGTHPEGYDTWCERESFALDATTGSPPDTVFTCGQDWGFPPPHPERTRESGYRYFINYIRHHLQHAGMLRIDHVMGLHRLFWIPKGSDASNGVYVRYKAEELYAILALESHRHQSIIVGENLGTVPAYVGPNMTRHGLQRMYVLHYELAGNSSHTLNCPRRNNVASLNTHDMPPFAAFWRGLDIEDRLRLRLVSKKEAQAEARNRQSCRETLITFLRDQNLLHENNIDITEIFRACLSFLCASPARVVIINLEDLWLETESQNIPGTDDRNPNWCRKARYSFEEFCQLPGVRDTLEEIDRLRKQRTK